MSVQTATYPCSASFRAVCSLTWCVMPSALCITRTAGAGSDVAGNAACPRNRVPACSSSTGSVPSNMASPFVELGLLRLERLDQLGHDLVHIAHDAEVR